MANNVATLFEDTTTLDNEGGDLLKEVKSVLRSYKTAGGKVFRVCIKAMQYLDKCGDSEALTVLLCSLDEQDSRMLRYYTGKVFPNLRVQKVKDGKYPIALVYGDNGPGTIQKGLNVLADAASDGGSRLQSKSLRARFDEAMDIGGEPPVFDAEKYARTVAAKVKKAGDVAKFLEALRAELAKG